MNAWNKLQMVSRIVLYGRKSIEKTYWKAWFGPLNLQVDKCKKASAHKASVTLYVTPIVFQLCITGD